MVELAALADEGNAKRLGCDAGQVALPSQARAPSSAACSVLAFSRCYRADAEPVFARSPRRL
jgi:hypothetical protein